MLRVGIYVVVFSLSKEFVVYLKDNDVLENIEKLIDQKRWDSREPSLEECELCFLVYNRYDKCMTSLRSRESKKFLHKRIDEHRKKMGLKPNEI